MVACQSFEINQIHHSVKDHDYYFQQLSDGLGRMGLLPLQKVTAVFRMLAYGLPADATEEYVKIGESTAIESMTKFCRAMVEIFAERYLRTPNANDIARLLYIGKKRGFPGMLGSLDCMHWKWKNCPTAWSGQYTGRSGSPTIILEAVADYDLWIWHAYFGMPGTNNDINVLESSNLFSNLAQGIAPPAHYVIQGKEYNMGYYLADDIYSKWATIVQTIQQPQGSARFWKKHVLHDIMTACIIMHNMIIEDERDLYAPIQEVREAPTPEVDMVADETTRFTQFIAHYGKIKDKDAHLRFVMH
ncbi:uncharacterized protein LOC109839282 [Asparagus officinalis]|uniref:uncharacterized protein LOC109839282 n=1 Tax=Asparagus officinalis TaxID=4686 RepID=UPI00098E3C78|nr:uncharacterized protein LOC109839282 [Asparagus officinalis]